MFAPQLQSEASPGLTPAALSLLHSNRVVAGLRLGAVRDGIMTRLADLAEGGGYRIKFPDAEAGLDAVIVNTGGGLLGGDRLEIACAAGPDADLMVTSQSAEKVYRAAGAASAVALNLNVASGARLHWLPMETILFSGARLRRSITVDMAADAEVLVAETTVFGRLAMGETLGDGLLEDCWQIRRAGRLVHADFSRLDGDLGALLARPAVANGATAIANLVLVSPRAEAMIDPVRALMQAEGVCAGASAWNGRLALRLMASDPAPLRTTLARVIAGVTNRPNPRFW